MGGQARAAVDVVLHYNFFSLTWAALIVCNMALFVSDVDSRAGDESVPAWMPLLTAAIVILYMLEVALRLHVWTRPAPSGVEDALAVQARFESERADILRLCCSIDADKSGNLSLENFVKAFDTNTELVTFLSLMDIHREDLAAVFGLHKVVQVNGSSSEVSCNDLAEQLMSLKMLSPQRMLLYNSYHIHNKLADFMTSIWETTSTAQGVHAKELRHATELIEKHASSSNQARGLAIVGDASSEGIASESKAPKPKMAETCQTSTAQQVAEPEVQKCMDRLRRSMEEELNSIAHAVASSLRDAAAARAPLKPHTPRGAGAAYVPSTFTPRAAAAAGPDGTFGVVDEFALRSWKAEPLGSTRKASLEAAKKQNLLVAEKVKQDLLKLQDHINYCSSLAADMLGGSYPTDPVARDYQIALVQLQLRLNEGLSITMADVMTKIHPAAPVLTEEAAAELLALPSSEGWRGGASSSRKALAPLAIGPLCGMGHTPRTDACCGKSMVIVSNESGPRPEPYMR